MASSNINYDSFTSLLAQQNIIVDGAEIHGIICGMLAGGMKADDQSWLPALSDVVNQGDNFSITAKGAIVELFNETCQQFIEPDFSLALCLPDDATPINDRGTAVLHWVQGFLLGFGLHQADLTACSEDVKEGLEDFTEIARMDEAMNEDEESEQALFEVIEYVRITTMLCFNDLGKLPLDDAKSSTLIH